MPKSPGDFCEKQFSGEARLFPLPGLVMFPHVIQALHIFEPRYQELLADALQEDQLIAMATLADGWQGEYERSPPLHSHVCLGQITSHSVLEDGCSNILLVGLRRAKIVGEMPSDHLYRMAQVELLPDVYSPEWDDRRCDLQRDLIEAFETLMPSSALLADQLSQVMDSGVSLSVLTDAIGYSLELPTKEKQALLGECNVDLRAQWLLDHIADWTCNVNKFPPGFSLN